MQIKCKQTDQSLRRHIIGRVTEFLLKGREGGVEKEVEGQVLPYVEKSRDNPSARTSVYRNQFFSIKIKKQQQRIPYEPC